jgi:hypothetical protein
VPGIGCLFCGSCSIGCLFCSGGCGADCSIGCQYCGTCCTSCNSCCNTCCTCCCGSCKTKTPKVPKVGGGSGGKGGAGGASPSAGGLSATNLSPALCGQASALTNTGGNYSIDALEKVDPHQLVGAPMSPQLMMGYAKAGSVKESNIVEGEHDTPKSGLGQLVEGISGLCLKNATPSFMCCSKCTAFHPQMTQHNTELKSLQQIKPVGKLAKGGLPHKYHEATPEGHHPEFITGITGYYACGGGTGQSDDIPAILHDGDYVMDAETVSALGDGSSKAGMHVLEEFREKVPHHDKAGENPVPAKIADGEYVFPSAFVTALGKGDNKAGADILDGLREKLREHKRGASIDKIPPKAKSPLDYIKKGKA